MANRPVGKRRNPDDARPPESITPPTPAVGDLSPGEIDDFGAADAPPDREAESFDEAQTALPKRVESWRKRSATGAILTGFAFGLQQVFEPERKEPAIVMETSGEPPRDLPVEAELEMATSRRSVVRIRPWLLDDGADAAEGSPGGVADSPSPSTEGSGAGDEAGR